MKHQVDKMRSDREFHVGDLVSVKLQPYRQKTVANKKCLKLSAKYVGPYKVLQNIGVATYQLKLHLDARVHLVFHVSQLKQHLGQKPAQSQLLMIDMDGLIVKEPKVILDRRMNKRRGRLCTEVLV